MKFLVVRVVDGVVMYLFSVLFCGLVVVCWNCYGVVGICVVILGRVSGEVGVKFEVYSSVRCVLLIVCIW